MSEVGMTKVKRGSGWFNNATLAANSDNWGESANWEGYTRRFNDVNPTTGAQRSRRDVICQLVRNAAAVNLLPKKVVAWKAGYEGKRVDAYTRTTAQAAAGIVDEYFNAAGVPPGEMFWLTVKGPTLQTSPVAEDVAIAAGDNLVALTAAATGATQAGSDGGRLTKQDTNAATTPLANQVQNRVAVALSANTTGQTNRDYLVDVRLY